MPHKQARRGAGTVGRDAEGGVGTAAPDATAAGSIDDSESLVLIPQVNPRRDREWESRTAIGSMDVAVTADQAVRAADERRDKSLEIFGQPDWTLHQALAWICYRDPERMSDLSEGAHRRLVLYGARSGEEADANCAEALRRALVDGKLTAFRNGVAVPTANWMGRTLPWSEWRGFHCHSKAVLEIWPSPSVGTPNAIEQAPSEDAQDPLDAISQRKLRCTAKALRDLDLPDGMSADRRLEAVNAHLKKHNDGMTVSLPTIKTALEKLAKLLPKTSENFRKLL